MGKTVWLIPALLLSISGLTQQATTGQQSTKSETTSSTNAAKIISVSLGVAQGNRIGGDMPVYPAIAKAARVQGTVVLRATISKEGTIEDLKVISGPPMLQAAAMDAVRTWQYKPYLLNGEPVRVQTQVNVVFSLGSVPPAAGAQNAPMQEQGAQGTPVTRTVQITGMAAPDDQPAPEHPITADQVREMLQLTGTVSLTRQMLDGMMPALKQSLPPYMPADVLSDFENTLLGSDFEAVLIRTYQTHLSVEDGDQIIAFYKTAAGRDLLQAMPEIAKESQQAGRQLGMQVMEEVLQRHQDEIQAAKQKYEMLHPWSAPKN